jgi:hypothetical protein
MRNLNYLSLERKGRMIVVEEMMHDYKDQNYNNKFPRGCQQDRHLQSK